MGWEAAEVSETKFRVKLGEFVLPGAYSVTGSDVDGDALSYVLVSGPAHGTAVIAGIFQTKDNDAVSRMPFVHNIPIIGALFRSHDVSTSHDELLIFITPRIVRGS